MKDKVPGTAELIPSPSPLELDFLLGIWTWIVTILVVSNTTTLVLSGVTDESLI